MNRSKWIALLVSMVGIVTLAVACGGQAKFVVNGNTVQVQYKGTLADGTVFDPGNEPLTFTVGQGQVIQGFEAAVKGMKVGDSKTVTIPAAQAYGPVRQDLIVTMNKSQISGVTEFKVGQIMPFTQQNGSQFNAKVTAVTDTTVTLDANHELAGKDLTFYIKVLDIK